MERPDSLSLDQGPQSPDMSKYKTDPQYAITYMEIPGDASPKSSPGKSPEKKGTPEKSSPEAPAQPSMAFTIDMGDTTSKGLRLGEGPSKFLPNKVRKSFTTRNIKKDEEVSSYVVTV